ncbi:MAG: hypothetical protein MJZ61_09185 [Bacteroidales bacterium]|nr:hypothetical protein [Bacteroidales bacterium]
MKRLILLLVAGICLFAAGCSDSQNHKKVRKSQGGIDASENVTNVVYTKYGIPLPVDLFRYLVLEDVPFNMDLLTPLENREKYTKETKQAMILGVYSADIAYCSLYRRQQEVMDYFNCAFKIADRLDIAEGFNFRYVERMEYNVNSADSLSLIANESYWKACNYLNENEKNNILPFVIYGGWVESQYLTISSNDMKSTRDLIMNQQEGLQNLINYLYEVMIESSAFYYNYDIKTIIFQLTNLKKVYDKVPGKEIDAQLYTDICVKLKTMRSDLIDPAK